MKKITDGDLKKLIGVRGKPRLVPVGACVWLKVSMNARGETSKRWLTRYYEKGKPIKRIIGSFPELSLEKAKALAYDLRSPIDPPLKMRPRAGWKGKAGSGPKAMGKSSACAWNPICCRGLAIWPWPK